MNDSTPSPDTSLPPSLSPYREGELGHALVPLLSHGFLALQAFRETPLPPVPPDPASYVERARGFAGDRDRLDVLVAMTDLAATAKKTMGIENVTVQLDSGLRVLYREHTSKSCRVRLVGEERPGEHRKSTPRNMRRALMNFLPASDRRRGDL